MRVQRGAIDLECLVIATHVRLDPSREDHEGRMGVGTLEERLQGVPCRVELAPALQGDCEAIDFLAGPDDGLVLELGAEVLDRLRRRLAGSRARGDIQESTTSSTDRFAPVLDAI
jgi:hypothetical protein